MRPTVYAVATWLALLISSVNGCANTEFDEGLWLAKIVHPTKDSPYPPYLDEAMEIEDPIKGFTHANMMLDHYLATSKHDWIRRIIWSETKKYEDMFFRIDTKTHMRIIYCFEGKKRTNYFHPK